MTFSIVASNWGWPQMVYLVLSVLSLVASMYLHGSPRQNHNGYVSATNFLLAFILLAMGGFFA